MGIIILKEVWARNLSDMAHKDILDGCVPSTLWQEFEEDPHMCMMVGGLHTFGHKVCYTIGMKVKDVR